MSSNSSANTAVITLPPGYDLQAYLTLQGQLVTVAICAAVAFGIIAWDFFTLLPDEIAIYRSKDRNLWRTPTTWFFITLRYSGILATLPSLFFTSVQTQHCQLAASLSQVGAVLAVVSSGIIFSYRVFAIWNGHKPIYALVILMFLLMTSCWIAVASQYRALTGSATSFGSNCQLQNIVSWAPISFASSVAFDSVVLLLTLAKVRPNLMMAKSAVGRQVFRDTLMYFTITTVTNITVLSIQSLGTKSAMIKPTAVPFSTVMIVTMGSRVYINLKLLDKRRQRETEGIPLSMPLSSRGSPGLIAVERNITTQEKTLDNGSHSFPYVTPYPSPGTAPYSAPYENVRVDMSGYSKARRDDFAGSTEVPLVPAKDPEVY